MMRNSSPQKQVSLKTRYIIIAIFLAIAIVYPAFVVERYSPSAALTALMVFYPIVLIPLGMLIQETLSVRKALRNKVDCSNRI